jgi:hypothetical protein
MKITRLLAGTALALSMASGAYAAEINGSIGITLASVTSDMQPIATGATFSNDGAATTGGTGDFSGVPNFTFVNVAAFTATGGQTFSFTSAFGDFTGTISTASQGGPSSNRTVTVFALGTFTGAGTLAGFAPSPASITFTANQTGGSNEAISASFTLAAPPAPPPGVPEPMSMALFGLGLAGLGVAMRRKA